MWRRGLWCLLLFGICPICRSQADTGIDEIMNLTGAVSVEELDPDETERLEKLLSRPLRINLTSSYRLKESGLFSHYQLVSLEDYRCRHGDVLSMTELSAVDGFGNEFVRKIAPFISLETSRPSVHIAGSGSRTSHELVARYGLRKSTSSGNSYGLRYSMGAGERFSAGLAISKSTDSSVPDALTGNLCWRFRRRPGQIVAGSFNARFGQGLALWNGLSISGLCRPGGFRKRSSSISPSSSFTGRYAFRGIAAEVLCGRLDISAAGAFTAEGGVLPALNLTWLWDNGQMGLTHYSHIVGVPVMADDRKTSVDISLTLQGIDLFAETAYDWVNASVAALAGTVFPIGEDFRMAAMLRYYPTSFNPARSAAQRSSTGCTNEYGTSVSAEFFGGKYFKVRGREGFGASVRRFSGNICADAACFPVPKGDEETASVQLRAQYEMDIFVSESLEMKFRLNERIRSWGQPFRTDLRLDCIWHSGVLGANLRANIVRSLKTGFLSYAELCFRSGIVRLYLRQGFFLVDNWEDRIYAYERDVPGGFNVPAFYGRGVWTALTGSLKFARWGRLYVRGALTAYPFLPQKKPGRAELKLLLKINL